MTRSNAHSRWLHGPVRKWLIGTTVVALAAWLFEFSTHIHLGEVDDVGSQSAAHLCGYCAALQVGHGPASAVVLIAPASTGHVEPQTNEPIPSSRAATPYRSRAPPLV